MTEALFDAVKGMLYGSMRHRGAIGDAAEALGVTIPRAYALRRKGHLELRRDKRMRALAQALDLDERTHFYAHKGVAAFERDWTSVTEGAALWRVEQRAHMQP